MPNRIKVKICGLSKTQDVAAASEAGAAYLGFNFFEKSPRFVSFDTARELCLGVPIGVAKVGLTVDESNDFLDELCATVPLDMLQLHGREDVARIADVKARYGLPVIKVIGVREAGDLDGLEEIEKAADQILLDAKPPKDAVLPGGNGIAFDWKLVAGRKWTKPWMLAGGLTPDNVAKAIKLTGARQVDVSSGVESAPGQKSPELITNFCQNAQST